jgi:hypothetical protein
VFSHVQQPKFANASKARPDGEMFYSALMRRFFDPATLFFLAAMPVLLFIFQVRGMIDPGTMWHPQVGELILADGFMTTDPFTFHYAGQTWIPQQWGGEVIMAILKRIGGYDAMLVAFLALFAAAFSFAFRRLLRSGMGWPLAAGITAFAMVAAGFHFYVRPHVFTIAFMIIVTAWLADYHARRISLRIFLWIIPMHVIWTNLHGGMLGGLVTFALFLLDWFTTVMRREPNGPVTSWRSFGVLLLIWTGCVLAMFVNPIGIELQRTWFRIVGSPAMAEFVTEHTPMTLSRGGDMAVLVFGLLYLFILVGAWGQLRDHPTWFVPMVWFAVSVQSIRNGPLFVAVAVVMIAEIWPHTVYYRRLLASGDLLARPLGTAGPWSSRGWILPSLFVIICLLFSLFGVLVPVVGAGWAQFDDRYVPLDMTDAVRDIPPGSRIFNDANFGGFLIANAPHLKIFMDDRFELSGEKGLREYVEAITTRPERFDDWQAQHGFEWVLIAPEAMPALAERIAASGRWRVVAVGRIATLYRLASP